MTRRDSGGPLGGGRGLQPKAERDQKTKDSKLPDEMAEELRDFLAADLLDPPADPAFKERLRRELWEIVERNAARWRARNAGRRDDDPKD